VAVDTEAAMAALFALLDPLTQFKTTSRRLQFVEDMAPEALPAVFQNQVARTDQFVMTQLFASDIDVEWYVYCFQAKTDAASTPILNPLVDAIIEALPPDGGRLVLASGAQVTVSRAGPTHYFEGLLGERAVARIPLRLRVPLTPT
jgi:hypothetical protein